MTHFSTSQSFAQNLDQNDILRRFKNKFVNVQPDLIYLDGNSLGRLPMETIHRIDHVTREQWGKGLIRSWNDGWFTSPQRLGDKIAQLVGAAAGEVLVSDSTSVNLFKLVTAALGKQQERKKIISDTMNFPSDLYILQGCIRLLDSGHSLVLVPSKDSIAPDLDALYNMLDENTALVTLSQVVFKSGYLYDVAEITRRAHAVGALVLWDLSHSAGALPVCLGEWQVDLAVGCTYKYLNGGPGSPAFLYIREDLQNTLLSPLWGWFGQDRPFDFSLEYSPAEGIERFLCGTPPVLSTLAMEPALDMIIEIGLDEIRRKSTTLTDYFLFLFDEHLSERGFSLGSPRSPERRGAHVSIRHPDGYRINRALIERMQVIPDFREPDNIRLGFAPLYTSYSDIWESVQRICRIMDEKIFLEFPAERMAVT